VAKFIIKQRINGPATNVAGVSVSPGQCSEPAVAAGIDIWAAAASSSAAEAYAAAAASEDSVAWPDDTARERERERDMSLGVYFMLLNMFSTTVLS